MHAGPLIDSLEPFSAEVAEGWMTAALAEASALRLHDDKLWPISRNAADLEVAHQLRAVWAQWADDAERLLNRINVYSFPTGAIPHNGELIHALGRTRAMLKLTPEAMIDRQERVDRGDVMTIEEVRRELRLEVRK
jgi:hypothetical protein